LPLLHVGTTGLPLLGGALGQAKRSEEIDGTAANQWQAGPGRNQAGRDGDVQDRRWPDPSGRVRPGAARGQAVRRLQVPAPHITKVGDSCTVTFPKAGTYPFFCQVLRPGHEGRDHRRVGRRLPGRPASRPSTGPAATGGGGAVDLLAALGLAKGAAEEREAGGTDVKQRQAQMAYRAWRVEG